MPEKDKETRIKPNRASQSLNQQQREKSLQREKDVVPAGTVQFRIDSEIQDLLTRVANHKRTPPGVLARMWVVERLYEEANKMRQHDER